MCGRFTYKLTRAEIVKLYRLTLDQPARNTQPRYNICPTTTIYTVVSSEGKRALVPMRWGLIPGWWSKPLKEMRLATFNARAETVATKPMFRDAFKSKRCLIPASGNYEWHDAPGGKQPYYFTRVMVSPSRSQAFGRVRRIGRLAATFCRARWSSRSRTSSWPRCVTECR
jgi:putative SOS response-associated peptidase YedK